MRNRRATRHSGGRGSGFTLIELLTVIAVIAILVGLVMGLAGFAARKADYTKATADLEKIKDALEEYRIEYGRYPQQTTADDSTILSSNLWRRPQADGLEPFLVMKGWTDTNTSYRIMDPWGRDYRYYYDGDGNPYYAPHNNSRFGYDLWSEGPNGTNSDDDIANWKGDF